MTISRRGTAITVNGTACGSATVANTSAVNLTGSREGAPVGKAGQKIVLDESHGTFRGATGDILFHLTLANVGGTKCGPYDEMAPFNHLQVIGTPAGDAITLGDDGRNVNGLVATNLNADATPDIITAHIEELAVSGQGGNDTLSAQGGHGSGGPVKAIASVESVSLDGDGGNDRLLGSNSDDCLAGGPGNDYVNGELGADHLFEDSAANGADTLIGGGDDFDLLDYSARRAGLSLSQDGLANDGQAGERDNIAGDIEEIAGGRGNDRITITGNRPAWELWGGLGSDVISEKVGTTHFQESNILIGCYPSDGPSSDLPRTTIKACKADGHDVLNGSQTSDYLFGDAGNDTEFGNGGDDQFGGTDSFVDTGADDLHGGPGTDTVVDYLPRTSTVTVTMNDNVANDGQAGERDNVHSDIENLYGAGEAVNNITGTGVANVLLGGGEGDVINGLAGNDSIDAASASGDLQTNIVHGGDGNDYIRAPDGNDKLYGDNGNDEIHAGGGNDLIDGGAGNDFELGDEGDDTFFQGATANGSDEMSGGPGTDTVDYSARAASLNVSLDTAPVSDHRFRRRGNDGDVAAHEQDDSAADIENILGGSAPDVLTGDADANLIVGNGANDTIDGGSGDDVLQGSAGNDTITGDDDNDILQGGDGSDTLSGGLGADVLQGGASGDVLHGDEGNDTLEGDGGTDDLWGDGGSDTASYVDHVAAVTVSLDGVANDGSVGEDDHVEGDVENATGGSGDDHLIGNGGDNALSGGPGDDLLDGGAQPSIAPDGADVFVGGADQDTVSYADRTADVSITEDGVANDGQAGEGDNVGADVEVLTGGSGNDSVTGSGVDNVIDGGDGNDTLDGGLGTDDLTGGSGNDTVSYASHGTDVTATLDGTANDGSTGQNGSADENDLIRSDVENLTGGSGNDTLTGNSGPNHLDGGPGDDTLHGGDGNDILDGSAGNDTLLGEGDDDTLNGGDDADYLDGAQGSDTMSGNAGVDTVDYSSRTTPVTVDQSNLTADDGESGEKDLVENDVETILGGSAANRLIGGSIDNTLVGGPRDDYLDGGPGNDNEQGRGGNDLFYQGLGGANGNDTLSGGGGEDTVSYAGRSAPVSIRLGAGGGSGQAGEQDALDADIEDAQGGIGADTLIGSSGDNALDGGPGGDTINGGEGSDVLIGGTGTNTLSGGGGDDLFQQGQAPDGADSMSGGGGSDTVDYSGRTQPVSVSLDDGANDGQSGEHDNVSSDVHTVYGGTAADTIVGSGDADTLFGDAGDDTIDGGFGEDQIDGGSGVDTIYGGPEACPDTNTTDCGDDDVLDGGDNSDQLCGGVGHNVFTLKDGSGDTADGGPGYDSFLVSSDSNDQVSRMAFGNNAQPYSGCTSRAGAAPVNHAQTASAIQASQPAAAHVSRSGKPTLLTSTRSRFVRLERRTHTFKRTATRARARLRHAPRGSTSPREH
ncbi:MAG: beta strand repeat-containing protein [Solirubrobacteraceae bacterium]